ncbi:MAG: hypothetical protein ABGZ17_13535, partial [Planctomycetaceae bacterium]
MSHRNRKQISMTGPLRFSGMPGLRTPRILTRLLILSLLPLPSARLAADEFVGIIKQIDLVTGTLEVHAPDAERDTTFTFGRSSRIRSGTGPTTLIMLQIGQPVTVQHQSGSKRADLVVAGKPPQVEQTTTKLPTSPLVVYQRGTLPIIITAPHGGRQAIPGAPERSNKNIR